MMTPHNTLELEKLWVFVVRWPTALNVGFFNDQNVENVENNVPHLSR